MDDLKIGIVIAQLINFGILFFVFKYFLGDKLASAISERREKLEKIQKIDEECELKVAQAKEETDKLLSDARANAEDIMDTANSAAKKRKAEMLEKAELEASSIVESGRRDIEKEKLSMMNGVKQNIVDLALRLNKKLFDKESANKDFLEKELEKIS